ncbi:SDR family NAD(P)-dependent oxidoreductase [Leisingera sp. JC1]|uniref:SDR family NAD(P)-dependent oxidoreductase n=1 Tax=Leisingera sp. JC1 TaxID=1855282 RepID=UPI000802D16B|nr:SDR family oxidoreductase [Leisingera sp. JC1]OBY26134.1 epimerase [Leisingera sp. JC1]
MKSSEMQTLSGKTVLVTGATGTIGAAIARELSAEGARLILHFGRNRAAAETLAEELGNGAFCAEGDLSTKEGPDVMWQEALAKAGEINALVNNAGILSHIKVDDPLEDWHTIWTREMQVNFHAAAELCRAAILHFRTIGGGRIVNIASRAGQGGYRGDAMPYGASKAALINLTQSIAGSFGGEGISAVAIAPGWVRTSMAEAYIAEHGAEAALGGIPIRKMAEPAEIGELVSFVLRGSQHSLTGAVLDVNGASQMR